MACEDADIIYLQNPLKSSQRKKYPQYSSTVANQVWAFHRSMPAYKETPLLPLVELAAYLGLKKLWIKDESQRFNLKAFKVLGASFALAKWLDRKLASSSENLSFDRLVWLLSAMGEGFTLATGTDGNHGYGVAWLAQQCGCKAEIFMPANTSPARVERVKALGAHVHLLSTSYDQVVIAAKKEAQLKGWLFLQDTTTDGDEAVPQNIMQGYLTILHEVFLQLEEERPTHVLLQAGVGAFAAALQAYLSNRLDAKAPKVLIVEPRGADCFYRSAQAQDGQLRSIEGQPYSVMAGLCCGTPSRLAWSILRDEADGFLSCKDRVSYLGMRVLYQPLAGDPRIFSGESGAVTLGALFKIYREKRYEELKTAFGFDENAKVLLISTEGDTDPEGFRRGIWEDV